MNIIYQVKVIYFLGPLTITAGNVKQFCWKITQSPCGDLFLQNDNLKRVDCWVGDVKTCNNASLSKKKWRKLQVSKAMNTV